MARSRTCNTTPNVTSEVAGRLVSQIFSPRRPSQMKKVLVVVAILVAAAACGGAGSSDGASYTSNQSAPKAQTGAGAGAPSKAVGQPNGTTSDGSATLPSTTVPTLQGPPVIRQASLSLTVASGA